VTGTGAIRLNSISPAVIGSHCPAGLMNRWRTSFHLVVLLAQHTNQPPPGELSSVSKTCCAMACPEYLAQPPRIWLTCVES
jgi:hypothetical protein